MRKREIQYVFYTGLEMNYKPSFILCFADYSTQVCCLSNSKFHGFSITEHQKVEQSGQYLVKRQHKPQNWVIWQLL